MKAMKTGTADMIEGTEARERFREVAKKLLSGAKERGLKLLLENLSAMRLD